MTGYTPPARNARLSQVHPPRLGAPQLVWVHPFMLGTLQLGAPFSTRCTHEAPREMLFYVSSRAKNQNNNSINTQSDKDNMS